MDDGSCLSSGAKGAGNVPFGSDETLKADSLIKQHMIWAAGAGLIPIPAADIVAITAVQLKLLAQLAKLYGAPFRKEAAKAILGALFAGTFTGAIVAGTRSVLKLIPIMGHSAGACALSIYAAATTYAVGQVFVHHFRTGGTFLDFDPGKVKARFRQLYEKALEQLRLEAISPSKGAEDAGAAKRPDRRVGQEQHP